LKEIDPELIDDLLKKIRFRICLIKANKTSIGMKETLSHLRHEDVLEVKDGHTLLSGVLKGIANGRSISLRT
jgi:hypothetical protein